MKTVEFDLHFLIGEFSSNIFPLTHFSFPLGEGENGIILNHGLVILQLVSDFDFRARIGRIPDHFEAHFTRTGLKG